MYGLNYNNPFVGYHPNYNYYSGFNNPNNAPNSLNNNNMYNPPNNITPNNNNGSQERIWVQGEAGAKAYMVVPGAECILWDSESAKIYIKSADYSGKPNLQILNYSIYKPEELATATAVAEYVTKAEFETLRSRIDNLSDNLKSLENKPTDENKSNKLNYERDKK